MMECILGIWLGAVLGKIERFMVLELVGRGLQEES